jgi:hypothetical protein
MWPGTEKAGNEAEKIWRSDVRVEARADRVRNRIAVAAFAAGLAWLAGSGVAWAQRDTFNPSVGIGGAYTDNIQIVGNQQDSDSIVDLVADLPWVRETRKHTINLRYRPTVLRYDEYDVLDREEHDLAFNFLNRMSRGRLTVDSRVNFSQRQGDAGSLDESDLFLSQRADRDVYQANVRYSEDRSRRWRWEVMAGGAIRNFDPVEGAPTGGDPSNVNEDRDELITAASLQRNLSRTASLGVEYGYRYFDLEFSGDENSHLLGVVYSKELSRRSEFEVSVGGYFSKGEAVRDPSDPTSDDERTGFSGRASYTRDYRSFRLQVDASHLPTSGGNSLGTSTNTVIGLTVRSTADSLWDWRISPRVANRDPSGSDNNRTSAGLRGMVERAFNRRRDLSIRLDANYVNQSYQNEDQEDRSIFTAALNLLWYPIARTELARGR